jgi:azurin
MDMNNKKQLIFSMIVVFAIAACTNNSKSTIGSSSDTGRMEKASEKPTAEATVAIPGVENLESNNRIELTANDRMQFSDTLFKVNVAEKVVVKLTNIGNMPKESMGHNFAVLNTHTDFVAFATEAMKARDTEYIPAGMKSAVIAHTKLIGPNESDEITFTLPAAGIYDFLCTFPGHYGSMRGKIVAE